MYILPGLLVAIGSYVHASRLRPWGLPMVIFSSLAVVIIFTLLCLGLAFYSADLRAWLNLSLALAAVVTMIVSIVVHSLGRAITDKPNLT
jgi:Kef-type K+ transport system membrane component KefB